LIPYYEESGITIYNADCREILPELEPVDCVVTDPPYGVGLTGKSAKKRGGGITKRNDTYRIDDTPEMVKTVVVPVIENAIKDCKAVVVTPGTRCLWLYPAADDMGCFYSASGTGVGRWGFTCMQPILYYGSDPFLRNRSGSRANSHGQSYPNDANAYGHPCVKPFPLWKWLVYRSSWENETILDPFMGSGTTLRAAKELGRKAVGIEIEEK
jgi:DNA modification methylase